jgi:hypothetical protein
MDVISWAAFKNILQQCLDNSSGTGFADKVPNGNWALGNEWYWIHINNNEDPQPKDLGDEPE